MSHHHPHHQGSDGHDDLERRLAAALDHQAAQAPDAETVRRAAASFGARRRRRRRATAVVAVVAVAGLGAASVPLADDLLDRGPVAGIDAAGRTTASPGLSSLPTPGPSQDTRPPSSTQPLPWTVPGDEAPLVDGAAATAAVSQAALDAFYDAGYSASDAAALATLWGRPDHSTAAASAAGTRLLERQPLPFAPGDVPANTDLRDLVQTFTGDGHDVDQALALARLWDLPSGYQAAQRAGQMLATDVALPQVDAPRETTATGEDPAILAFVDEDLGFEDAEQLAALWGLPDPAQAKVAAGHNLLAAQPVPQQP